MVKRLGRVSWEGGVLAGSLVAATLVLHACGEQGNDTNVAATGGAGGLSGAGQSNGGKGAAGEGASGAGGRGGGASGSGGRAGSPGGSAGEAGSPMGSGGGAGEAGSGAGSAGEAGLGGESGEGGSSAGTAGAAGSGGGGAGGSAGSSGGGGSGGGACSDIQNTAPEALCVAWTGEPVATGGVVIAGTYHLETESFASECFGSRVTFRISQVTAVSFRMEAISIGSPVTTTWMLSGTVATSTVECGSGGGDVSWNYSVLNNQALPRLRFTQPGAVYVYVRVGD